MATVRTRRPLRGMTLFGLVSFLLMLMVVLGEARGTRRNGPRNASFLRSSTERNLRHLQTGAETVEIKEQKGQASEETVKADTEKAAAGETVSTDAATKSSSKTKKAKKAETVSTDTTSSSNPPPATETVTVTDPPATDAGKGTATDDTPAASSPEPVDAPKPDSTPSHSTETIDTSAEEGGTKIDTAGSNAEPTTEGDNATTTPAVPENNTGQETAPTSNPCEAATTCSDCVSAASTMISTNSEGSCQWKDGTCVQGDTQSPTTADMCPEEDENKTKVDKPQKPDEDDDEDDINGSTGTSLGILFFLVASIAILQRVSTHHGGLPEWLPPSVSAALPNTPRGQRGSPRGSRTHYTERVPLASNHDDDEWGWEDSSTGGDVELATTSITRQQQQQEEDDLRMALAMSMSEKAAKRSTSGGSRRKTKRTSSGGSWDDSGETESRSVSHSGAAGLRKVMQPASKRDETPKDDIFASMGLSAKPKFSKPGTRSKPAEAPRSGGSAALAASNLEEDEAGSWGDDSDLDDLLND